jgi:hypothetical protein
MLVVGRWDLLSIRYLPGQFGGRMDQGGKTSGTDVQGIPQVLQGHKRNFLFGFSTVQTGVHGFSILSRNL